MTAPPAAANRCTFIETNNVRFLIMDSPNDENLPTYIEALQKHRVSAIVRACTPNYETKLLSEIGIRVVELPFKDGDPPPDEVVSSFLELVDSEFSKSKDCCIAVHCVAGLGRAPVLVAIALVESGMDPLDAIAFIRKRRRGAINARQLKYIENYKRRQAKPCCVIC